MVQRLSTERRQRCQPRPTRATLATFAACSQVQAHSARVAMFSGWVGAAHPHALVLVLLGGEGAPGRETRAPRGDRRTWRGSRGRSAATRSGAGGGARERPGVDAGAQLAGDELEQHQRAGQVATEAKSSAGQNLRRRLGARGSRSSSARSRRRAEHAPHRRPRDLVAELGQGGDDTPHAPAAAVFARRGEGADQGASRAGDRARHGGQSTTVPTVRRGVRRQPIALRRGAPLVLLEQLVDVGPVIAPKPTSKRKARRARARVRRRKARRSQAFPMVRAVSVVEAFQAAEECRGLAGDRTTLLDIGFFDAHPDQAHLAWGVASPKKNRTLALPLGCPVGASAPVVAALAYQDRRSPRLALSTPRGARVSPPRIGARRG